MENLNRKQYLGVSGIYRIQSLIDYRCYIGSSKDLYKRINLHIAELKSNKHHSIKLQRFCNKYGINNLKVVIIQLCPEEKLIELENFYKKLHDSYHNGFDTLKYAYSPIGYKWTDEMKMRHSNGVKERLKNDEVFKNKIFSNLEKARKSAKENPIKRDSWNKGISTPEEVREKQRIAAKNRGLNHYYPIIQMDKKGNFIKEYQSSYEAQRQTGIYQTNINKCCLGKRKTAGKFIWKFKDRKLKNKEEIQECG